MAKVLCVLYDDPVDGYPQDLCPRRHPQDRPLSRRPDRARRRAPSTSSRASCSAASPASSGLRKFLEKAGHTLVVTSDKDGPNSVFEKELPDAEIVISQPFWPAYMTKERFDKAKKLKLVITAGIGSDHTDLQAAMDKGITVAEVTYCNSISVVRARRHDDPGAGAQLHPVLRLGGQGRLEHRRLRRALLRPRRHECRHRRRRPHRPCRAAPAEALRRQAALHRQAPPAGEGREGARAHLSTRTSSRWSRCATWSPSTRRCIPRPRTCSTTS